MKLIDKNLKELKIKFLQRRLARKEKGSNNRYQARLKVAKLQAKIADCRQDKLVDQALAGVGL